MNRADAIELVQSLISEQADEFSDLRGVFSDGQLDALDMLTKRAVTAGERKTLEGLLVEQRRAVEDGGITAEPETIEAIQALMEMPPTSAALRYIGSKEADNPQVQCPICGFVGNLMEGFSLLAAGFVSDRPKDCKRP